MGKRIPQPKRNFDSYQIALLQVSMEAILFDFQVFSRPGGWTTAKKTLFVAEEIKYTWDEI
jgi:hypothetical protein